MIEFYTAQSSNGQRAAITLEECELPYRLHKLDLMKGEQKAPHSSGSIRRGRFRPSSIPTVRAARR